MSARLFSVTIVFAALILALPVSAQEVNRPPARNASAVRQPPRSSSWTRLVGVRPKHLSMGHPGEIFGLESFH